MKITVILSNNKQTFDFDHNVKVEEVYQLVKQNYQYPVYVSKVNNAYRSLSHVLYHDSTVEFLDINSQACWLIYQNGLIILYSKAVHDVLGKNAKVSIENSLNKGLYTFTTPKASEEEIEKIEKRMQELVSLNLPIIKEHKTKDEAINLAKEYKAKEAENLLSSIENIDDVEIYSLEDETLIFYGLNVPSTGYLDKFELKAYHNGVLLRYPHPNNPNIIPDYKDETLLYDAFREANKWGQLMHINYVDDLNNKIKNHEELNLFLMQEALHEKRISDISDMIKDSKKRIVLICGPSSSGKTTFAKRLCIQLAVNGLKTLYLGTDDYYKDKKDRVYLPNGEVDLESINAIDTELFIDNLKDLLAGKEADLPIYSFISGNKEFGTRKTKISNDQIIVIEGIHGLNDKLTEGISNDLKFKIYISPFTPIGIDHINRIPTTDARMLRRMVRDYNFRGTSAKETLDSWPKVREGENNNIFPYSSEADVFFNSNCIYELSVLKKYAEPLLKEITRKEPQYPEAQRMLNLLKYIEILDDDSKIVNNSILREFIGGSVIV